MAVRAWESSESFPGPPPPSFKMKRLVRSVSHLLFHSVWGLLLYVHVVEAELSSVWGKPNTCVELGSVWRRNAWEKGPNVFQNAVGQITEVMKLSLTIPTIWGKRRPQIWNWNWVGRLGCSDHLYKDTFEFSPKTSITSSLNMCQVLYLEKGQQGRRDYLLVLSINAHGTPQCLT